MLTLKLKIAENMELTPVNRWCFFQAQQLIHFKKEVMRLTKNHKGQI